MTAPMAPDEGMPMGLPLTDRRLDGLADVGPGLKVSALERKRPQDFPPGLDEVAVGGIDRLEDELPAWMGQRNSSTSSAPWVLRLSTMAYTGSASAGSQAPTCSRKQHLLCRPHQLPVALPATRVPDVADRLVVVPTTAAHPDVGSAQHSATGARPCWRRAPSAAERRIHRQPER